MLGAMARRTKGEGGMAVNEMLERIKARNFDGVKARVTYYHTENSCYTMRQGKVALKAMA